MALQILNESKASLAGTLALSEAAPSITRAITIVNTGPERLVSLKAYVAGSDTFPAERTVTIGGVAVTGDTEATGTELLSAPLEPGASLAGTETFGVNGAFQAGFEPLTLHLVGLPEV